ncbi:MAG: TetR/AcrR family transcriptional regulator [Henriciella sp.]|uniref:TetR/AcrR family transcriptional regulator n=1 Tax=Henriciella sp. TaxID=1968823 RepID=UPI003C709075
MARRPKRQAERRRDSMALILDCAEAEFAKRGYDGTTLAAVAKEAGVDTALMRYYFVNKRRLFVAVVKRRSEPSNRLRQEAMAAYREKAGDNMTLEGIIDAFTRPAFELGFNDEGWRNYAAIITFVAGSRGWLRKLMTAMFDHVSRELIADMKTIMPHATEADLYWAYHFMTAAYVSSIGTTERIDVLSGGTISSSDFAALARRIPIFVAAGIRAMIDDAERIDALPFEPMPAGSLSDELVYDEDLDDFD